MTLNIGHVYACTWQREKNYTFFNVIHSIDTAKLKGVFGRCIGESYMSGQFEQCNDEEVDWEYGSWTDPNNSIIDLGPYQTFYTDNPELFI